jgi:glycosyltransferase involved in cell wall biosynthesis
MRICLDVQSAVTQRAGVGRYTRSLAQHLAPLLADHEFRLFYFDFKRRGTPLDIPGARQCPFRWCPGALIQQAWKRFDWPPFERVAGKADVYHFPNFIRAPGHTGRSVVTLHDMAFMRHPEFTEAGNLRYLRARIHETASRADAIITVSAFSAAEVQDLLHVPPSRIFAIHPGISPSFRRPSAETVRRDLDRMQLRRPYLLTVGTVEPRKNLPFLMNVFEHLPAFDGDLVIAGMPGWKTGPIMARMQASPCANRIRYIRYVDDAALPSLYAGAELYLLTSFYEGFGFPPLEAMACGTPVLASMGGSLPEVLGEGARLVSGFDLEAWIHEAGILLSDRALRNGQVDRGSKQAARYDWTVTAQQTRDVYVKLGQSA